MSFVDEDQASGHENQKACKLQGMDSMNGLNSLHCYEEKSHMYVHNKQRLKDLS